MPFPSVMLGSSSSESLSGSFHSSYSAGNQPLPGATGEPDAVASTALRAVASTAIVPTAPRSVALEAIAPVIPAGQEFPETASVGQLTLSSRFPRDRAASEDEDSEDCQSIEFDADNCSFDSNPEVVEGKQEFKSYVVTVLRYTKKILQPSPDRFAAHDNVDSTVWGCARRILWVVPLIFGLIGSAFADICRGLAYRLLPDGCSLHNNGQINTVIAKVSCIADFFLPTRKPYKAVARNLAAAYVALGKAVQSGKYEDKQPHNKLDRAFAGRHNGEDWVKLGEVEALFHHFGNLGNPYECAQGMLELKKELQNAVGDAEYCYQSKVNTTSRFCKVSDMVERIQHEICKLAKQEYQRDEKIAQEKYPQDARKLAHAHDKNIAKLAKIVALASIDLVPTDSVGDPLDLKGEVDLELAAKRIAGLGLEDAEGPSFTRSFEQIAAKFKIAPPPPAVVVKVPVRRPVRSGRTAVRSIVPDINAHNQIVRSQKKLFAEQFKLLSEVGALGNLLDHAEPLAKDYRKALETAKGIFVAEASVHTALQTQKKSKLSHKRQAQVTAPASKLLDPLLDIKKKVLTHAANIKKIQSTIAGLETELESLSTANILPIPLLQESIAANREDIEKRKGEIEKANERVRFQEAVLDDLQSLTADQPQFAGEPVRTAGKSAVKERLAQLNPRIPATTRIDEGDEHFAP